METSAASAAEAADGPHAPSFERGQYILTNTWWNKTDVFNGQPQPHVARIDEVDADNQTLQVAYFYRPHETYHKAAQQFYLQEVLRSPARAVIPFADVLRQCAVLSLLDFRGRQPVNIPEKDVYVCCLRYAPSTRSTIAYNHHAGIPLEPLTRARSFTKAHCDDRPITLLQDLAASSFTVTLGNQSAVNITFVPDSDVRAHIHNVAPQNELPPSITARTPLKVAKSVVALHQNMDPTSMVRSALLAKEAEEEAVRTGSRSARKRATRTESNAFEFISSASETETEPDTQASSQSTAKRRRTSTMEGMEIPKRPYTKRQSTETVKKVKSEPAPLTYTMNENGELVPTPRKRGRPRKYPLPGTPIVAAEATSEVDETESALIVDETANATNENATEHSANTADSSAPTMKVLPTPAAAPTSTTITKDDAKHASVSTPARATTAPATPAPPTTLQKRIWKESENDDYCKVCSKPGQLLCCDGCPNAYHPRCARINPKTLPEGDWFCPACMEQKKNPGSAPRAHARAAVRAALDWSKLKQAHSELKVAKSLAAVHTAQEAHQHGSDSESSANASDSESESDSNDEATSALPVVATTTPAKNSSTATTTTATTPTTTAGGASNSTSAVKSTVRARAQQHDAEDDSFADNQRARSDAYFSEQRSKRKTSSRTLASLNVNVFDEARVTALLSKVQDPFVHDRQLLLTKHHEDFADWNCMLRNGFNVLLHGFGSKKRVLMAFSRSQLQNVAHMVVNGYVPSLHVKHILKHITEGHLGGTGVFKNLLEQVSFIRTQFEEQAKPPLVLIIHSIDGGNLRNELAQTVLSQLSAIPQIHLIASIDHINAPLLWDHEKLSRFNWVWRNCATFDHYTIETSYEASMFSQNGSVTVRGAMNVMQSLTRNGRKVFWILAQYQLEHSSNADYRGLRFAEYLSLCQQQFAAHDDSRLRSYMTEFTDHQLLHCRKYEGVEYLTIPVDGTFLASIIESMTESFPEDKPR